MSSGRRTGIQGLVLSLRGTGASRILYPRHERGRYPSGGSRPIPVQMATVDAGGRSLLQPGVISAKHYLGSQESTELQFPDSAKNRQAGPRVGQGERIFQFGGEQRPESGGLMA